MNDAQGAINSLKEENAGLISFKAQVEKEQKEAVIAKYSELLSEEIIESYTAKMDTFTVKELDKELAYELVSNNQSVFSAGASTPGYIPKEEPQVGGLEEILSNWRVLQWLLRDLFATATVS